MKEIMNKAGRALKKIFTSPQCKRILGSQEGMIYLVILLFIIVMSVSSPFFRSSRNISNLIMRMPMLFTVAIAQAFVMLGGGIDLSVGSILAFSTCVNSLIISYSIPGSILLSLAGGCLIGVINGLGVSRLRLNPFIMTLGIMSVLEGVALFLRPKPGGDIPKEYIEILVFAKVGPINIMPLVIMAVIGSFSVFLLRKTRFGTYLYAVGDNEEVANLSGINVGNIRILSYLLSGLFASIGGLYMTARIGCGDATIGPPFLLDSIAAAVVGGISLKGGKGKVIGVIAGVILIGMLSNVFNLIGINTYWQYILKGVVFLGIVTLTAFQMGYVSLKSIKGSIM